VNESFVLRLKQSGCRFTFLLPRLLQISGVCGKFLAMNVSVAGIAVDGGKLFVARRVTGGSMGGKWEFPGGKVEEGETCEQALVREFLEEFGADISVGNRLAETEFEHKEERRHLKAFLVNFLSLDFTLREHTAWRWASCAEIRVMDFTPSDLKLLDGIERHIEAML
jgi:8-oxo-dGTP diphosphatase